MWLPSSQLALQPIPGYIAPLLTLPTDHGILNSPKLVWQYMVCAVMVKLVHIHAYVHNGLDVHHRGG